MVEMVEEVDGIFLAQAHLPSVELSEIVVQRLHSPKYKKSTKRAQGRRFTISSAYLLEGERNGNLISSQEERCNLPSHVELITMLDRCLEKGRKEGCRPLPCLGCS